MIVIIFSLTSVNNFLSCDVREQSRPHLIWLPILQSIITSNYHEYLVNIVTLPIALIFNLISSNIPSYILYKVREREGKIKNAQQYFAVMVKPYK